MSTLQTIADFEQSFAKQPIGHDGKNWIALRTLVRAICASTTSIYGIHGFLGYLLSTIEYLKLENVDGPFVPPVQPVPPIMPNMPNPTIEQQRFIMESKTFFKAELKDWTDEMTAINCIKLALYQSLPSNIQSEVVVTTSTTGIMNVSLKQLFASIDNKYNLSIPSTVRERISPMYAPADPNITLSELIAIHKLAHEAYDQSGRFINAAGEEDSTHSIADFDKCYNLHEALIDNPIYFDALTKYDRDNPQCHTHNFANYCSILTIAERDHHIKVANNIVQKHNDLYNRKPAANAVIFFFDYIFT